MICCGQPLENIAPAAWRLVKLGRTWGPYFPSLVSSGAWLPLWATTIYVYIHVYTLCFSPILFQIISQMVFLPGLNSGGSSGSTTCDKCDGKHATERLDLNRRRCPNERVKHPPIERLPKYVSSSPTIYIIIYIMLLNT